MGTCFSTLLYCPPVYENGRLIYNSNCNKTTCSWSCECVKKELKETNQEWRQSIEDISEAITIDVLQIVTDQIKESEEDFNKLIPNQEWKPITDRIFY